MSENSASIPISEELFNTEELMQSEDMISDKNSHELALNSEDHETQINLESEPDDHETEVNLDLETENHETEITDDANEIMETDENAAEEMGTEIVPDKKAQVKHTNAPDRLTNLPLAKIKHIIKLDPDVNLVNSEAVYLITKSTEMFIKSLAKESYGYATQNKKKTITKAYVDQALANLPVEL